LKKTNGAEAQLEKSKGKSDPRHSAESEKRINRRKLGVKSLNVRGKKYKPNKNKGLSVKRKRCFLGKRRKTRKVLERKGRKSVLIPHLD